MSAFNRNSFCMICDIMKYIQEWFTYKELYLTIFIIKNMALITVTFT